MKGGRRAALAALGALGGGARRAQGGRLGWRAAGRALAALGMGAGAAGAQTLEELQAEIRENLGKAEFASYFAAIGLAADEFELSGGSLDIGGTRLERFALPYRRSWLEAGETLGVYAEGVLGIARVRESAPDLYSGGAPGLETAVEADWITAGALAGVGPIWRLRPDLTAAWIGSVGLSYLESRATYSGPGAAFSQALLDGIAFNWDAWAGTWGSAGRIDWSRQLARAVQAEAVLRYDLRWSETLQSDDPAQEYSSRLQLLTLRTDLSGPTPWSWSGRSIDWRCYGGWQRFTEGSLLGAEQIFELGSGIELGLPRQIPVLREARINAALLLGDNLSGWSLGVSFGL